MDDMEKRKRTAEKIHKVIFKHGWSKPSGPEVMVILEDMATLYIHMVSGCTGKDTPPANKELAFNLAGALNQCVVARLKEAFGEEQ